MIGSGSATKRVASIATGVVGVTLALVVGLASNALATRSSGLAGSPAADELAPVADVAPGRSEP